MEFEVSYSLENEQQFWDELDDITRAHCDTHEAIDNTLRSYLSFTANFKDEYLQSADAIARCSYKLLGSALFQAHEEYVRRQIVYGLLQEDDPPTLHLIAAFLLFDGRADDQILEMMAVEGAFPRLVELIQLGRRERDNGLHQMLLELLYEMSRIQRLTWKDLSIVDDVFIMYLLQIIEGLSDDVDDPYHYPVIRVLLVLNEQYMMSASTPSPPKNPPSTKPPPPPPPRLTNRLLKTLSAHLASYRTFGENLILLLNRETLPASQLLILKLLYLIFTTPATYEYFYTNDLYVLLDVILRNLLDLDLAAEDMEAMRLRHMYLRVLDPLLANTQVSKPPYYKREEVAKVLAVLEGRGGVHFAPVDETTLRLVGRCARVPWVKGEDEVADTGAQNTRGKASVGAMERGAVGKEHHQGSANNSNDGTTSPTTLTTPLSNVLASKRSLGMGLAEAGKSNLSVLEVASMPSQEWARAVNGRLGLSSREREAASLDVEADDTGQGRSPFADSGGEE
ncbi:hypothetical protein B0A49_11257 [Cryomyces minteri]|uniref:SPIN90/Ldb17 leucine-rich domain-containing protein n=1 Tax=Cryomyces minteri TaxID=331657 RepID=A0A4U0VKM2_9PEZI|nr:hypothetical protein B0A49_11257 [Cryomyces minteri]